MRPFACCDSLCEVICASALLGWKVLLVQSVLITIFARSSFSDAPLCSASASPRLPKKKNGLISGFFCLSPGICWCLLFSIGVLVLFVCLVFSFQTQICTGDACWGCRAVALVSLNQKRLTGSFLKTRSSCSKLQLRFLTADRSCVLLFHAFMPTQPAR